MLEYIKNKVVIYFAIFGAVFSLLLGLIAGIKINKLLLQTLIGGLVMGALGFGIVFIFMKFMPSDEVSKLFSKDEVKEKNTTGQNVDLTDDDELSPEDLLEKPLNTPIGNTVTQPTAQSDELDMNTSSSPEGFQETNFDNVPRVKTLDDGEPEDDIIKNELNRMKDIAKGGENISSAPVTKKSDKSFKIGDKKVTADPKIIAKAIRTVLNKD